jgi:hypothetical protein
MPTALQIVWPGVAAFIYYATTERHSITDSINIFQAWFFAALLIASYVIYKDGDKFRIKGANVVWLLWASWWVNDIVDFPPIFSIALLLVAPIYMLAIALKADQGWPLFAGGAMSLQAGLLALGELNLIPGYGECGPRFLDFCGPDLAFIASIAMLIALIWSIDDDAAERNSGIDRAAIFAFDSVACRAVRSFRNMLFRLEILAEKARKVRKDV